MNKFDVRDAILCAELSKLAYDPVLQKDYLSFGFATRALGYECIATIDIRSTDTQAYIVRNDSRMIIVFRGTQEFQIDGLIDAKIKLVNGSHEGFYEAAMSARAEILNVVKNAKNLELLVTGHSLGGALAKMIMLVVPEVNWANCYTFGSPPVCDEEVAGRASVKPFLVTNEADIVPRVLDLHEIPQLQSIYGEIIIGLDTFANWIDDDHSFKSIAQIVANYAKSVAPDQKRYTHFGTPVILSYTGELITDLSSIEAFSRAFGMSPKRVITDHFMASYTTNLNLLNSSLSSGCEIQR